MQLQLLQYSTVLFHKKVTCDILFTKITNKMQQCRIIYGSLAALHVSSDIFAHHQEHLNCFYSFWCYTRMSLPAGIMGVLQLQLCRIIYYSLAALRVSSDIFAHHEEHLNCFYSFWYYTRTSLPAGILGVLEL